MDTKGLERSIKTVIKTGSGYGPEFKTVLKQTKDILKRINKGRPNSEHYFQLGSLLIKLEDSELALEAFLTGYQLNKSHVNCGLYSALIFEQKDEFEKALSTYRELNLLDPENIHIAERMLMIFYQANDIKQVLITCDYFLERDLHYPSIYEYISKVYYDCGNKEKAVEHMNNALRIDSTNNYYIERLITISYESNDFQLVLDYEEYILGPGDIAIALKLMYANSLAECGETVLSRSYFAKLYWHEKEHRMAVLTTIALFHMNYEMNNVRGIFINNYILKRDPTNPDALSNIALIEGHDISLSAYQKVLENYPDNPDYRRNYGHRLLKAGDLKQGFEFYESRVNAMAPHLIDRLSYPEVIKGKKLFFWNEQGLGDLFIWSWLFRFLEQDNVDVKIQVDDRLVELMQRSFPNIAFRGGTPIEVFLEEKLEKYDAEMVFVSIGKYYIPEIKQAQIDFEKGSCTAAHLKADVSRINHWKDCIKTKTSLKTVGVCWRSSLMGDMRDQGHLTAENIANIFSNIDCCVVNVQYDCTEEELNILQSALGDRFINFTEINLKNDQDELAALMMPLDLVFSVGTAVFALAGALGIKTINPSPIDFLGKPYQVMLPSVKTIAGPIYIRDDTENQKAEITKALKL